MSEELRLNFIVPDGASAEIARIVKSVVEMSGRDITSVDGAILHSHMSTGGSFKKYDQERMATVEAMIKERVSNKRDEDLPLYVQYSSDEQKTRFKTEEAIVELSKEGALDNDF